MWGAPLARQIREGPPELVRRADVKKPETSSGFWNWWPIAESNHGHADFQDKLLPGIEVGKPKKTNKFLSGCPNLGHQPNPLPNFCKLSVASWPFYRTASMGCAEVHRPAADMAMEPSWLPRRPLVLRHFLKRNHHAI